jgi:lysyl-tRNA synthetase class 1
MYKSGRMNPAIVRAPGARDRIAGILEELTGKKAEEGWSPFNPLCPGCGRITGGRVLGFSAEAETVDYACECGAQGTLSMTGGGKLTWRVDWPARWWVLGVTIEPFGKDHASKGGSYDTGIRIVREVFGVEPPSPIPYEWIGLKGMGDMSSSKGNVISVADALEVMPPDVLRYLVVRSKPMKAITFDPGLPVLSLVDEYDDAESKNRDARAIALSRASSWKPVGVPFKHLVVVLQIAAFDRKRTVEILAQNGYKDLDAGALGARIEYAARWLEKYAPEEIKFRLSETLPPEAARLDAAQKEFLGRLAKRLAPGMSGDEIHALIYELAKESGETPAAHLFEAIYLALAGKTRGPRAGAFLSFVGAERAARRFAEAASSRAAT